MKKFFTLALALLGFAGVANAANVDDLAVLKHSYVLVCDNLGARPGKGVLFGDNHFLDVNGGTTATNKGKVDLSQPGPTTYDDGKGNVEDIPQYITEDIIAKYGTDYAGAHSNFLRLKNDQDVIALKLTAKSKIIIFEQGNNKVGKDARIPCIAKSVDDIKSKKGLNAAPDGNHPRTVSGFRWEYTVDDDGLYYIGSYNGDMFVSFIIIEANEAPGTPTVKVGEQKFEGGLWFREVTCKANNYTMEGTEESIPTIVTYTTDGSTPTAASPVYNGPIKCYKDMTVKFQAYQDWGTGADEGFICANADNEANVAFLFDAPTISTDGANVTVTSPYEGAENYILVNGDNEEKTNSITLEESATITAYSKIINGDYAEFTTKKTSKDVYVLNPIKEKKTIVVTTGTAVIDEEATATSTTGPVYKVEGGAISADKKDFFVKNLTFSVLKDEKAQYQVPEGQEIYIQMSNTNITFQVAEGDSVDVKVVCTKNSCKNLEAEDAAANKLVNGCTPDRSCYVNVSGTNYCHLDADGGVAADLKLHSEANVITFGLHAGTYTFQKYSGTGNILISSIEITPVEVDKTGISTVKNEVAKSATFNLAGQKVSNNFKGIIVKDGKKIFK
jgi:hypothetical protein